MDMLTGSLQHHEISRQHKSPGPDLTIAVAQIIFLVLHAQLAIYSSLYSVGSAKGIYNKKSDMMELKEVY